MLTTFSLSCLAGGPVSDIKLSVWANTAIISVYNFDAKNLTPSLKDAAKYFSGEGWKSYMSAFINSGLKNSIETNGYKVSSVTMRPPKVTKEGQKDKNYFWDISMPIVVLYKNKKNQQVQYLKIDITVEFIKNQLKISRYVSKMAAVPDCPISKQFADKAKDDAAAPANN